LQPCVAAVYDFRVEANQRRERSEASVGAERCAPLEHWLSRKSRLTSGASAAKRWQAPAVGPRRKLN